MKKNFKVTAIATISSALECYDFVIYASLIPYLNQNFFSNISPSLRQFCTLMVFAVGYISRPVGGLIFGTIGDKYGRKKTFIYSLSLMAIATVMIALLPTAAQIGSLSTILLILFRYIQGVSQGGEVPGAITFISEHIEYGNVCKSCSFIFLGLGFGALLSSSVCYTLTSILTEENMIQWGWRLPFIFGGILGIISFLIRKNTQETPHYIRQAKLGVVRIPLAYLLKYHPKELLKGISLVVLATSLVAFTLTYPSYMNSVTNINTSSIYLIMSAGMLTMALLVPVFGKISDVYGPKKVFAYTTLTCILFSPFVFSLVSKNGILLNTALIVIIQGFISGLLGSFPALLANLFPSKIRYTGVALSYNIASAISAFIPAIISFIELHSYHHFLTGFLYSIIGFFSLFFWKNMSYGINFLVAEEICLAAD